MNNKLQGLVSNKKKILLTIIELVSKEERWYTVQEISEKVGLVERSIQRYVNDLYDIINDYNKQKKEFYQLQLVKNKGVRLLIEKEKNVTDLEQFIYQEDETIQILLALLLDTYSSSSDYSIKNGIASSTMVNSFDKITAFLKPIDLSVSRRDFRVLGSESQIRALCSYITWGLFNSEKWPSVFNYIDKSKIDHVVVTMSNSLHLDISDIEKREFTYMIAINIIRYRKGNIVEYLTEWNPYVPKDSQFELNKIIESVYNSFHIFSHEEVRFAVLNLLTKSFIYNVPNLKKTIIKNLTNNNADVLTSTELFMTQFSQYYPEPSIDYDDTYLYILRGHLAGKLYKQANFNFSGHGLKNSLSSDLSRYFIWINEFISKLEMISKDSIFLEKDYLAELYFLVHSPTEWTTLFEDKINIFLESDLPEIAERHIEEFICNQFKHHFNIVFIRNRMLITPDLVLTNITTSTHEKTPHLTIDYPMSERSILEIEKLLCNFISSKKELTRLDSTVTFHFNTSPVEQDQ